MKTNKEQDPDQFLNQLIERHYKRLVNVFHNRLDKARDKEFAISLFIKRVMAFTEFRIKLNDEYRGLMESLEEDYRLGRSIAYSINKLRKNYANKVKDNGLHRAEIISMDENGTESSLSHTEKRASRYGNINNFNDEELIRMYAEYQVNQKFTEFLTEEAKPYLNQQNATSETIATIEDTPENEKNKEFTTTRQVLAIHYLLKYCQVKNVDNTEKARFIQFLTGKSYDNIYKKVQSPLNGSDKHIAEDLKYIRTYFERLGLKEIVKMVSNEIDAGRY